MINITGADDFYKIAVLNPKGGCGKTTLATNLASCYARQGPPPLLVDCDPQGFALRWVEKRPADRPPIYGIEAYGEAIDFGQFSSLVTEPERTVCIFDLPAAISQNRLHQYTYVADRILIPVMPSPLDVHTATRLVAELLLDMQIDRRSKKLAIVASRVRSHTRSYQMLLRFLTSLEIPMIATLSDSQNYIYASEHGIGVAELPAYRSRAEGAALNAIMAWLSQRAPRRPTPVEDRDSLIAKTAYRLAEQRGFQGGDPKIDWLEAERKVDRESR